MKITYDITDYQKSILLVLAIECPMPIHTLEKVVFTLSDVNETIKTLLENPLLSNFEGMSAMDAAKGLFMNTGLNPRVPA